MNQLNHNNANADFRALYTDLEEQMNSLNSFLRDIHKYVSDQEKKINKDLQMYSAEFNKLFYVNTYGGVFRSSFIITLTSVSEMFINKFCNTWDILLHKSDLKYESKME